MGFRLVLKLVTSNDLERVMAVILRYFTEFSSFGEHYVKLVKDKPTLSAKNVVQWRYLQKLLRTSDVLTKGTPLSKAII